MLGCVQKAGALTVEMQGALDQHNVFRCMHDVPLMTWDDKIAANAQAWADSGNRGHSPGSWREVDGEERACGENLGWGYPAVSGVMATSNWYGEIENTNPYGLASSWRAVKGKPVGHYTQLVWKGSTKLGCGKGKRTVVDKKWGPLDGDSWVCHYCPPGNDVAYRSNVLAPTKNKSECERLVSKSSRRRVTTTRTTPCKKNQEYCDCIDALPAPTMWAVGDGVTFCHHGTCTETVESNSNTIQSPDFLEGTPSDCMAECASRPTCVGFSHSPTWARCWFRSHMSGSLKEGTQPCQGSFKITDYFNSRITPASGIACLAQEIVAPEVACNHTIITADNSTAAVQITVEETTVEPTTAPSTVEQIEGALAVAVDDVDAVMLNDTTKSQFELAVKMSLAALTGGLTIDMIECILSVRRRLQGMMEAAASNRNLAASSISTINAAYTISIPASSSLEVNATMTALAALKEADINSTLSSKLQATMINPPVITGVTSESPRRVITTVDYAEDLSLAAKAELFPVTLVFALAVFLLTV